MCNWRNGSYTYKLVLIKYLIFLLIVTINGAEDCNYNDTVLSFVLKQIGNSKFSSEFENVNWRWPTCSIVAEHEINKDKISLDKIEHSWHWINQYIKLAKIEKILINMERGDDWVIGSNSLRKNAGFDVYFQFIDSRTLDVLFTTNLIIKDNKNIHNEIIKKMTDVLKFSNFDSSEKVHITINRNDNNIIEGFLRCQFDDCYCRIPKGKDNVLFWTNGNVIIVSIPKIRTPYKDKSGYNAKWTVGGISRNDKRSFNRFSTGIEIDYQKEMISQFPWVGDSLSKWRSGEK